VRQGLPLHRLQGAYISGVGIKVQRLEVDSAEGVSYQQLATTTPRELPNRIDVYRASPAGIVLGVRNQQDVEPVALIF